MDQNQYQPYQPQPVEPYKKKKVPKRTKLALWFILGPTLLIFTTILGYAVVNLLGNPSPLQTALNTVLFLTGAIGVLTWLPGLIAGIVLFATRPRA